MSALPDGLDVLLRRHAPLLRYDSQEAYFADSSATWTDNPANVLRQGAGRVLAAASPGTSGVPRLSLDFLGPTYPTGTRATGGDTIGDTTRDYAAQARALHQQSRYANVVYARASADSTDRIWLQYWYWYFYNEANLTAGFGRHEGDWEMVQLRLADGGAPDLAVYAQHAYADWRRWNQVETASGSGDTTPIVYVALGSHAAYFTPGTHPTVGPLADRADGLRESAGSQVVVVSDPAPRWLQWPGRWGDTRARGLLGDLRLFSNSPTAPCRHAQWRDPLSLQRAAEKRRREPMPSHPALAPAPQVVGARREGDSLAIDVRLSSMAPGVAEPVALTVTANSPDDRVPPRTARVELDGARERSFLVPLELAPGRAYEIHVSAMTAQGVLSPAVPVDVPAAAAHRGPAISRSAA